MEGVKRDAECAIGVLCHPGASKLALPAKPGLKARKMRKLAILSFNLGCNYLQAFWPI